MVYLYLTPSGGVDPVGALDWRKEGAVASSDGDGRFGRNFGMVVFQDSATAGAPDINTREQIQKVIMHETGHIIGAGRDDDALLRGNKATTEIYSGSNPDPDKEYVRIIVNGGEQKTETWSIMSGGWGLDRIGVAQAGGSIHFKYSIQETFTIELNQPVKETHQIQ